ncbi:MAG: NAD(P)-dependent oxidoreductase [Microthrixaceae bacterium]
MGSGNGRGAGPENGRAEIASRPVGFVGLGNIGAPMAARLLEWPGGLVVFDLDTAATESLERKGAVVASSAAEVASSAGLVCVMVNTESQVREVLTGAEGILAGAGGPGRAPRSAGGSPPVIAVHSTISPGGAVELAGLAAERGLALLDVPVSGGAMGAHDGTLALLVGGDEEAFERVREPLGLMGSLVHRFGSVGAGTSAKLVRNLITFASFAAVGEASRIADAVGLDLVALGDVVRHSDSVTGGPGAIMLRDSASTMDPDDPLRPIFEHSATLGVKDLELVRDLASSAGTEVPLTEFALAHLRAALGLEDQPAAGA